jgi:hypothetical protein
MASRLLIEAIKNTAHIHAAIGQRMSVIGSIVPTRFALSIVDIVRNTRSQFGSQKTDGMRRIVKTEWLGPELIVKITRKK